VGTVIDELEGRDADDVVLVVVVVVMMVYVAVAAALIGMAVSPWKW
jgi:hypothetical protein